LVNLWATWCAPCIRELPSLAKLQDALGGKDFAVLTIALDEPDAAKVAPFLAQHGAANLPALIDGNRTIDKVMPVSALPTSFLVDKEGKVRATLTGDAEWDCGAALAAVQAFVADGTVSQDRLEPCP
jgi:thiol-disulfide isomerase/thioredoxin